MHVKIGKYLNYIGPYQIADKIFFWCEKHPESKSLEKRWDYRAKDWLGDFLSGGPDFDSESWFSRFCNWIYGKRKRTIKIQIDKYDVWSMDHTLAMIIYPMLIQLNESKHGAPLVDDDDVPEELKSTTAPPKEKEWDTDGNHFARWDWIMSELIWTFGQLAGDEPDFWIVEPQGMYSVPCEDSNLSEIKWKVEGEYDHAAHNAHHNRIDNGLRLFGKYYRSLWD